MTYYNTSEVLQIIKDYHVYKANIADTCKRDYASVGVTAYNEEATLPRANTISDVTANEAIRDMGELPVIAQMRTDIKYLEDRLDRVTDDIEVEILALRMEGLSASDIGAITLYSTRQIHRKLVDIAKLINGTNLTDYV